VAGNNSKFWAMVSKQTNQFSITVFYKEKGDKKDWYFCFTQSNFITREIKGVYFGENSVGRVYASVANSWMRWKFWETKQIRSPNKSVKMHGIGRCGASCKCPNGQTFQSGEFTKDCSSIACINGEVGYCNCSNKFDHQRISSYVYCEKIDLNITENHSKLIIDDADWTTRYINGQNYS